MMSKSKSRGALAAAGVAAILGSGCCAGPILLASVGLSGAGVGILTVLEPYRPIFIGVALIALIYAWRAVFLQPRGCAPEAGCTGSHASTVQKVLFWVEAILILLLIALPYFLPPFD